MAGTIPLSMTQQFDVYGAPLSGGQLYIIQVGTVSTPQNAYSDTGLTIALPYPMTLDAAGRVPQFFLADGSVKIRLQDRNGVVQLASDSVLVIGASSGGGGGSTVDPTQLIQTGNMIFRNSTGALAGYVRLNNLTIGSATSGATERANADTQALFLYLWPDTTLAVSGGRGANAAADWAANKQIAVPDWRGYALGALDDMGNTPAGRLSLSYFGANPTMLGVVGGGEYIFQTAAQMPVHAHANVINFNDPGHHHGTFNYDGGAFRNAVSAGGVKTADTTGDAFTGITVTITNANAGSGQAMRTIGPRKLVTFYMKL